MVQDVLYYPTIEFDRADYEWLWSASLLWDKIYRIVPDGYELHEPRNIEEICSTGEIGLPISPQKYSQKASSEFLSKITLKEWRAAALNFDLDEVRKYDEYSRLHKEKVDVVLRNNNLIGERLLDNQGDWLYVPRDMNNLYMTYLAKTIATDNNLSLNTYNPDIWTASTYFLYDSEIQEAYSPGDDYEEPSKEALASIFVNDIMPADTMNISAKSILEFREKRKDERHQFVQALDNFSKKLSSVSDEKILRSIIEEERKEVEYALNEYRKSMDMLKVIRWTGYFASLITIATNALGYTSFDSMVIKELTSLGLGINVITGLLEKKDPLQKKPYSYLTEIEKITPGGFDMYSYGMYRKIEEFIND